MVHFFFFIYDGLLLLAGAGDEEELLLLLWLGVFIGRVGSVRVYTSKIRTGFRDILGQPNRRRKKEETSGRVTEKNRVLSGREFGLGLFGLGLIFIGLEHA